MTISRLNSNKVQPLPPLTEANFSNTATGTYSEGGNTWKFLKFTEAGTFTISQAGYADLLVVGGGGGGGISTYPWGGFRGGGGGGGGAVRIIERVWIPAGDYTVNIGRGGTQGAAAGDTFNQNGGTTTVTFNGAPPSSSLGFITPVDFSAPGGGSGGGVNYQTFIFPTNGASGGGGGHVEVAGQGIPGLGNNGGTAAGSPPYYGAGGGGAGGVGGSTTGASAASGGIGLSSTFDGGISRTYGAGGGSGGGTSAAANTGDGGGGGVGGGGGTGGSGVMVIRVRI